jgi:hypothetical protein
MGIGPSSYFFIRSSFLSFDPSKKRGKVAMGTSDENDYNGGQLVVIAVIFLFLTYLSTLLRFFVRIVITKSYQIDDWLMLVAQVKDSLGLGSK